MLVASSDLPDRGDPSAPAHQAVAGEYIARTLDDARLRYLGIMVVEFGVGAVVFGGILYIFDRLAAHVRSP